MYESNDDMYDDCGDYVDNVDNDVDYDRDNDDNIYEDNVDDDNDHDIDDDDIDDDEIDDDNIDDAMLTRLSSSTGCLALEQSIQPSLYT